MKEEPSTPGFSFQLSASAPPAEVVSHEPQVGRLDALEPDWFEPSASLDLLDPLDPLDPDIPTRTPAPVRALANPSPRNQDQDQGQDERSLGQERRPPAPAVKRISFPKAAATVFSDSVSQVPRVRLESTEDDPLDDILDAPPEDLPLGPATFSRAPRPAASALADSLWRQTRRWTLQGGRWTALAARTGGRWAMGATRSAAQRATDAWERRRSGTSSATGRPLEMHGTQAHGTQAHGTRPPEPSLAGDDVSPVIEGTPRPPSVVVERVRPVLPALAALAAAGACYMVVAGLVPSATTADSSSDFGDDSSGAATPALAKVEGATVEGATASAPEDAALPDGAAVPRAPASKTTAKVPPSQRTKPPAHSEQLALPAGLSWPGKGLIEVVTAGRELIYVDGVFTGRGPLRRIPVSPGKHEVLLRTETSELAHAVEVAVDRRTRLLFGDGRARGEEPEEAPGR